MLKDRVSCLENWAIQRFLTNSFGQPLLTLKKQSASPYNCFSFNLKLRPERDSG
jgi:type IV secretory pathway VirB4 component